MVGRRNKMEKFLTKENIVIIILVFYALIQSNYFATKLDLADLRNEMLTMKTEIQQYSDKKDEVILNKLEEKYEVIIQKLDRIKK